MRIKLDENLSRHLQPVLERLGHDVDTVDAEHLLGKSDIAVAAAARHARRILFTLDVEFANLQTHPLGIHPGIVLFRPKKMGPLTVNRFVSHFVRTTANAEFAKLAGCITIVEPGRIRVRRPSH